MWLQNEYHSVLVSPQGGSVLQWQWKEHTILGPARMVCVGDKLKRRGETHWCFPNFGSVPEGIGFNHFKHGFLRNTLLEVEASIGEAVRFKMPYKLSGIRRAKIETAVSVLSTGFEARLEVTNYGGKPMPILPALHPYFAVPEKGLSLAIGSNKMQASDVSAKSVTIERFDQPILVHLHGIGAVHVEVPKQCSHVVVWSDKPSAYICVEPIFGKPGTFGKDECKRLAPEGESQSQVSFYFEPE